MQGVLVDAWRRYRAVQGPLESALLTLYIFVAVVPALLVMESYVESRPGALADRIVDHYGLSSTTAELVRSVLSQSRDHHLGAALFAIAGALFFGLNFGRVLQDVHVRAWGLTLPPRRSDRRRYAATLLGLYGLILLLLLQARELTGDAAWVRLALIPAWVALLTLYFLWVKRMLTYKLVPTRDLLPAAVLTGALIVVVLVISSWVMEFWVNLYARDYGGFGVVMAIFFWIGLYSVVIVFSCSLSPALAGRRQIRHP
jgi:membrane protein